MWDLSKEVDLIPDLDIREWAKLAVANAPPRFFTVESSLSGKYHPADEFCLGGKILHTKRVVLCLSIMLHAQKNNFDDRLRSMALAAACLHDCCYDENSKEFHPHFVRPYYNGKFGPEFVNKYPGIFSIIEEHMGRWSINDKFIPNDELSKMVSMADTMVSKAYIKYPTLDDLTPEQINELK